MQGTHSYGISYGVGLLLVLSGCFGGPSFLKQNEAYKAQDTAIPMIVSGEVTSGTVSASSSVTQTLTAPATSSLSGVKLSVPPGALSINTTIHLEESATLATGMMSQNLGITLSSTAGRAVSISAENVGTSELSRPMTLAIPLNLSLWLAGEEYSLVIVYRTYKDGEVFDGVIPTHKIQIIGNEARFDIVRWGAYQPAYIPKAEEQKAVTTVEQKSEEKIITKTEQKKFPEPKMSALTINYSTVTYKINIKASLENAQAEKCYIESYGIETTARHFEWAKTPLVFETDFSDNPDRIYVKVKMGCYLKNSGLLVETTYSTLDIPADPNRQKANSGEPSNPSPTPTTTPLNVVVEGVGAQALSSSAERKTFFDAHHGVHWAFYHTDAGVTYSYSSDSIQWTQIGMLGYKNTSFSVTSKKIGSDSYIFFATIYNQFDIILRRGKLSKTGIDWDPHVTVFDGNSITDSYQKPVIALDGNQNLWVAAIHKTNVAVGRPVTKRTTGIASGSLSNWQASQSLSAESRPIFDLALVPRGGSGMYLLANGAQLVGYVYDGTNWSSANDGGSPSWFTFPPEGFNGTVRSMVFLGDKLYVGGGIYSSGGSSRQSYCTMEWYELGGIEQWRE